MKYLFLPFAAMLLCLFACSPRMSEEDTSMANSTEQPTAGETPAALDPGDLWEQNSRAGIDFLATGNEPFWSVKIDFDNNMVFSTPEEAELLVTPVPAPVRPQDVAAVSYRAQTEKGTMHVTIFREKCSDSMADIEYPYRVRVSLKTGDEKEFTEYEGCGRFQGDYRMNDIWALVELDGETIDPAAFPKGVPSLDLQLTAGKVYGNAGCNQYSGEVTARNNTLSFGSLISTKMACPALNYEQRYTSALSGKALTYKLEEGKLYLSNETHQLVFKKVD